MEAVLAALPKRSRGPGSPAWGRVKGAATLSQAVSDRWEEVSRSDEQCLSLQAHQVLFEHPQRPFRVDVTVQASYDRDHIRRI